MTADTKRALFACDLLGLHRGVSAEVRRLIAETSAIPPENVMISGPLTHSAATALGTSRFAFEQPLDDYQRFVTRRIADGVRRAANLLRPANPISYQPPPQNRILAVTERNRANLLPQSLTNVVS